MQVLKEKMLVHHGWGKHVEVTMHIQRYPNGRIALQLQMRNGAPYMVCTLNIPKELCAENEVFIKAYAENSGITTYLVGWGVIEPIPHRNVSSGYTTVPCHYLTAAMLVEIARCELEGERK